MEKAEEGNIATEMACSDGYQEEVVTEPIQDLNNDKNSFNTKASETSNSPVDNECRNAAEINPYAYIESDHFTSEIFKIEIIHPKRFGTGQLKKRLASLDLRPSKVKVIEKMKCAFVNFRCEEDREKALEVLNGHQWMGKPMKVKKAKPAADPLLKRRKQEAERDRSEEPAAKLVKQEDANKPISERLNDAVTPDWQLSYCDQVKRKFEAMKSFITRLGRSIAENNKSMSSWLVEQRKKNMGLCCHLHLVKTSPVINGYRNKAEFTIGKNTDGKDKTVGFRLGQYRSGNLCVVEPKDCVNIPVAMIHIVKVIQDYLQSQSSYSGYEPITKSGHWHTLTLRHNQERKSIAILQFHPQGLSQDEITLEVNGLREFLQSEDGGRLITELGVSSFYLHLKGDRSDGPPAKMIELTEPQAFVEKLLHLQFRVSPDAFFQVNTLGAEVLYSTIGDLCGVKADTTILDVCCGTGTIGLTLAKSVKKVIGIELCSDAVKDAKYNAQLNGISNTEYHCGKAEDILPWLIHKLRGQEVIAVVDPPRAGLHGEVVKALRKAHFVKRLIYVSCKPTAALSNLIDFTRSESNRVRGPPFRVIEAIPVDLFPHTPHCELILRLEREPKHSEPEACKGQGQPSDDKREAATDQEQAQEAKDLSEGEAAKDQGQRQFEAKQGQGETTENLGQGQTTEHQGQ